MIALFVWGIIGLGRLPYFAENWPEFARWSLSCWVIWSFVVFGLTI